MKLNILFAHLIYWTALFIPIAFVFGLHWFQPCKPSLGGFWLLKECYLTPSTQNTFRNSFRNYGWKIGVFVVNYYFVAGGIQVACFVVGVIQILVQMSMRSHICIFGALYSNKVFKMTSIDLYNKALIYREIQILGNLNNTVQRHLITPVFIVLALIVQGLSAYILVRLTWSYENLIPLGMYTVLLVNCALAIIVCIGGMANIRVESVKILQEIRNHEIFFVCRGHARGMEFKWLRSYHRSCAPIQIKFGTNFVEAKTPVRCMEVAVSITVNLLLLIE